MKISKQTFEIMKNFTAINNSIWFTEPQALKTISLAENIVGIFDTEEEFPMWQLYNSVPFMSMSTLFDPEKIDFDFQENKVILKTKGTRVTIVYDPADLLPQYDSIKPAANYKKFDNFNASFALSSAKIGQIQKTANILGLPDMAIKMKDGKGVISINDSENPDSNSLKIAVAGEGSCDIQMMVKNLQIVSGDYKVSVANNLLSKFHHQGMPLFYVVAAKKG
jgi:hypothetical protein